MEYKQQIKNFLEDEENYSLLISGSWGVGKTYLWKEIENEINPKIIHKENLWKKFKSNINFLNYKQRIRITLMGIIKYFNLENPNKQVKNIVYVSLFGKEHYKEVLEEITLKAYKHNKILYFIRNITFWKLSVGTFLQLFITKNFKNIIVCLDDLERKSDKLDIKDILGLINQLKEEKCKVILIGSIHELNKNDIEIFNAYKEKCIDLNMHIHSKTEVVSQILKEKNPKIQNSIIPYQKLNSINDLRKIKKIIYIFNFFYEKLEFKTELNNSVLEDIYKFILLQIVKEINCTDSKDEFVSDLKLIQISNIIQKTIDNYKNNIFLYIQKQDIEIIKQNIEEIKHYNNITSKINKLSNIIKQIKEGELKDDNIIEINQILDEVEKKENIIFFIYNFQPIDFFALANYTDRIKKQSISNIKNAYIEHFTANKSEYFFHTLKKLIDIDGDNVLKEKQEEIHKKITKQFKNKEIDIQTNKKDNENIITQIDNYNNLSHFIKNRQIKTNDIKELKENKLINYYLKFFFSYENNQIKYKELFEIYNN